MESAIDILEDDQIIILVSATDFNSLLVKTLRPLIIAPPFTKIKFPISEGFSFPLRELLACSGVREVALDHVMHDAEGVRERHFLENHVLRYACCLEIEMWARENQDVCHRQSS